MKLLINTKSLLSAVTLCSLVAPKKVLRIGQDQIKITVGENAMALEANNMEQYVATKVDAEDIQETGSCCVRSESLFSYLKHLDHEHVWLETNPEKLVLAINTDSSKYEIPVTPIDDFPHLNIPDMSYSTINEPRFLAEAVRVRPFSFKDETRVNLMSVLLSPGLVCATDGHRAGLSDCPELTIDRQIILPIESVDTIKTLFRTDVPLELAYSESFLYLRQGGIIYGTRLLSKEYPDLHKILPTAQFSVRMSRSELQHALKRAMVVAKHQRSVLVKLALGDGFVTLTSEVAGFGLVSEVVKAECLEKKEMLVGINGIYLEEALKSLKVDTVVLEVASELKPLMMREEGYTHVIMPVKL